MFKMSFSDARLLLTMTNLGVLFSESKNATLFILKSHSRIQNSLYRKVY